MLYKDRQQAGLRSQLGASRLEVFAVVTVLALFLQLLLPALNAARESSRRTQCDANLQQLIRAFQSYHDTNKRLPPAAAWGSDEIVFDKRFPLEVNTVPVTFQNWAIELLPYLDLDELHDKFKRDAPISSHGNADGRNTSIPVMNCPNDQFNNNGNAFTYEDRKRGQSTYARGNYAVNGGPQFTLKGPGNLMNPRPLSSTIVVDHDKREYEWWGEGIAGFNRSFSFDDFQNGRATTVALNEIRAGIHPADCRGVWALGQIGSSVTWAHGLLSDACGPNPILDQADDILDGTKLHTLIGSDRIKQERMPFCDHCNYNIQAASRSMHPGGVNLAFCDGAIRFVSDSIDQSIWHALHARNTPADMLDENVPELLTSQHRTERDEQTKAGISRSNAVSDQKREIANSIDMRFVFVPPGTYTMGLPDEGATHNYPADVPPHDVSISRSLYMGQYEVTQAQYERVMGINPSWFVSQPENAFNFSEEEIGRRPVENITWHEAVEFCQRLSALDDEQQSGRTYRLPTEAEWEYCCRSGSKSPYKYAREWRENDDSGEIVEKAPREDPPSTVPAGSYRPNVFDLYDMRGNVWEWCNDWFSHDYYSWSTPTDPPGPASGMLKVYRGCDWIFTGDLCKTARRCLPPSGRSRFIGFRVVCELRDLPKAP